MEDLPAETPIGNNNEEKPLEMKEYFIRYKFNVCKVVIIKQKDSILIKSSNYEITLIPKDFCILLKNKIFESIDKSFDLLKNLFNENNVQISDIKSKTLQLTLKYEGKNIEKKHLRIW